MAEWETDSYTFLNDDEREVERFVGIEAFTTSRISGIKGEYKTDFKDFIVKEILNNGKILDIKEDNKSYQFSEELKDRYTTFNLIKINRDTFDAIREICKALNISNEHINYSGLKDKFSISVQKVSIKGDYTETLKNLNIKDVFIRDIFPTKKPVKLGSHWGNHFTIILRNVKSSKNLEEKLEKYVDFLNKFGFPNYFGLQRFGNYRPNSHIVGRYLLENNFKKAFEELVIKTYTTESMESRQVRRELRKTGNLEKALNEFPKSLNYERKMIQYLIENPNDYEGCINTLSPDLKKLLISSFQSYIFNKILSKRAEEGFSLFKPMKGDVISILDDFNGNITQVKYIYGNNYDKYLKKALSVNRAAIIMPLIGTNTNLDEFPFIKLLYEKVIKQENIQKDIFDTNFNAEQEFKGSFRPMIIKPTGLKILETADDDFNPGKKKIKFEFSLQKGTYATMLIREFVK
ncbi:MAG: tRNA pseudouridine(13) synthase TruD [Candidatus Heimdallarchaeota archaeon]